MDLICPKCLEPFDNDVLHEVAEELGSTYAEVAAKYRSEGCGAAFAGSDYEGACVAADPERAEMVSATYDLLGDDMDGAASMFADGLL